VIRAFDLIAVAAVAVVLLLPKPSMEASPALEGDPRALDRVAALEDARYAQPDDPARAVALADAYLDLLHPDWALATTAAFASLPAQHHIHLVRATARAERLEAQACLDEAKAGIAACDAEGAALCPDAVRTRFDVISSAMKVLVDRGIDPRKEPRKAREAVAGVLHSTKAAPPSSPSPPSK
jgi:hypothetical protein